MAIVEKIFSILNNQINKASVKLPINKKQKNIVQDINMAIHNGVINEKLDTGLRGEISRQRPRRERKQ